MSFASDQDYHDRAVRAALGRRVQWKVDREANRTGKHFVEFYDQNQKTSPTGLLATAEPFWGVLFGDNECASIIVPTSYVRALCYPRFVRKPDWGGDHQAFAGALVDLTRLASFSAAPDAAALTVVDALHAQIMIAGPPPRQECMWPEDKP